MTNDRTLTKRQRAALKILKDDPRMRLEDFAKKFWPNHIMHLALSNQGHGACRGKKAWRCAGSYLGKLAKLGLVRAENTADDSSSRTVYIATHAALAALEAGGGE